AHGRQSISGGAPALTLHRRGACTRPSSLGLRSVRQRLPAMRPTSTEHPCAPPGIPVGTLVQDVPRVHWHTSRGGSEDREADKKASRRPLDREPARGRESPS